MSLDEKASFVQCLKILTKRTIALVTYEELDCSEYFNAAEFLDVHLERHLFDKNYFKSTTGYNKLCKSYSFYKSFADYDYMLIYQLDAWVFKDDLDYWCAKNYDYIGAPWFEDFGFHEDNKNLWIVGNGGFSLRKISYFLKILSWKGPVMKCDVLSHFSLRKILYAFGRYNTMDFFVRSGLNEDVFFSINMKNSWFPPKIPGCKVAAFFAFEKSPAFLFKLIGRLPFGCHAYKQYDYEGFWSKFIPSDNFC